MDASMTKRALWLTGEPWGSLARGSGHLDRHFLSQGGIRVLGQGSPWGTKGTKMLVLPQAGGPIPEASKASSPCPGVNVTPGPAAQTGPGTGAPGAQEAKAGGRVPGVEREGGGRDRGFLAECCLAHADIADLTLGGMPGAPLPHTHRAPCQSGSQGLTSGHHRKVKVKVIPRISPLFLIPRVHVPGQQVQPQRSSASTWDIPGCP